MVNTLTTVNHRPILSTPKRKRSRRVIYLDPSTVDVMRKHRALQQTERAAAGVDWYHEIDFVFRDELGRPIHPEWFTREFGRQARAAQLPTIRLHDLRHTFATLALKEACTPRSCPSAWVTPPWASPSTCTLTSRRRSPERQPTPLAASSSGRDPPDHKAPAQLGGRRSECSPRRSLKRHAPLRSVAISERSESAVIDCLGSSN